MSDAPTSHVPFRVACRYWLRLGLLSFGGPAGQIALMHRELVEEKRWMSEARFLHALNYCMLLPGPEAQQLATYIGWLMHRTAGGVVAGALFVLPSFALIVALAWLYVRHGDVPWIAALFEGLQPAVVALVAHAAVRIGRRTLRNAALAAIALAAWIAIAALHVPFPAIVLAAAAVGFCGARLVPELFSASVADANPDDVERTCQRPPHTRFQRRRLVWILVAGLGLWIMPMTALVAWHGWQGQYAQLGWFFSKAALVTFGGAYAVLPYVYQGAVLHYGWVSAAQMIDGLALGETTPGPLIMIVTFVGFIAGYESGPFAGTSPLASGLVAAGIATWFTFLPSFVFILGGGPWVESTHGDTRFAAPLTAIGAAVVGVIANLAVFFAGHTFQRDGTLDPVAIGIAIGAFLALQGLRAGAVPVLLGCGALGVLRAWWMGG
ncbi:MAG: chromate efflux transporter [Gammaproteobacteria bacterium]